MTREEFNTKIQAINEAQLSGDIGLLSAGKCFKEVCLEWLEDHDELPEGFEGFAN